MNDFGKKVAGMISKPSFRDDPHVGKYFNYDDDFKNNLISRLKSDVGYYLGNGLYLGEGTKDNPSKTYWLTDEPIERSVDLMEELYGSLKTKPNHDFNKEIGEYRKKLASPVEYNPEYHSLLTKEVKNVPEKMKYYRDTYKGNKRFQDLLDIIERL